jgi:excisionase family DNA binding protein
MKQITDSAPPTRIIWMTCQQAAERLDVSRQHVYHLVRSGRLPAYNRGNGQRRHMWRISSADLDAYMLTGNTQSA